MKRWLLAAALSFALPSCALFGLDKPEEKWVEGDVRDVVYEDLVEVSKQAFAQYRFTVKDVDRVAGQIVSSWRFDLNPYSRDEKRLRATLQLQRREKDVFHLRARVEREGNEKMEATMDPENAQWKPEGEDEEQARAILQFIYLKTKTFGPSDDFYKKERWKKPGG